MIQSFPIIFGYLHLKHLKTIWINHTKLNHSILETEDITYHRTGSRDQLITNPIIILNYFKANEILKLIKPEANVTIAKLGMVK